MSSRIRATDSFTGRFEISPSGKARWMRIVSRLDVCPGRWRLRIAARGADGQAQGSVFVEVDVPDFTRDLVLGGLVIGTPGRAGVAGANRMIRDLPIVPVAARELPAGMSTACTSAPQSAARRSVAT